jgi:ATP synthase protein I
MKELHAHFQRQKKYIFYLLALYALGWGFTPYPQAFLSLFLGTAISFYNLWMMVRKVERFGQAVVEGKKVRSLGMISRMAAAALAVFVAMEWPQHFSMGFVVLGLMTSYIVIIIDFLLQKMFQGEER